MKIKKQIELLEIELKNLKAKEQAQHSRKKFLCSCGKMHMIKDCDVIQTHWYVRPYSCDEGDYWNVGELRIICPQTKVRNRVLFNNIMEVEYKNRGKYEFDPEVKFRYKYKDLFKSVIDDYDKDNEKWVNNYYFDKNRKKFDIEVMR